VLVTAHGGRDVSHTGATRFPIAAVVMAGHGPLRALLVPLVAAPDALLGTMSGDIGRCLLVATRGRLPACLCRAEHNRLVAGGAMGGEAA
jgi:hypothetical protein